MSHKNDYNIEMSLAESLLKEHTLTSLSTDDPSSNSSWFAAKFGSRMPSSYSHHILLVWHGIANFMGGPCLHLQLPSRQFFYQLLPKYMRRGALQPKKPLRTTSYLDALRGIAALIVVTYHSFLRFQGYGFARSWITRQPFFKLLTCGIAMVDVFFVISGYVLSIKMLKLMRAQQSTKLLDTLASVSFRRYMRLYLSCAFATFCSMLLIASNCIVDPTLKQPNFFRQVLHWLRDLSLFGNPFGDVHGWYGGVNSQYIGSLWTIAVELRRSFLLYVFCTLTCKLKTAHRMTLCCVIILLSYWWVYTYAVLFLSGLLIADVSLTRHPDRWQAGAELTITAQDLTGRQESFLTSSPALSARFPIVKRILSPVFWWLSLFLTLLLLMQPEQDSTEVFFPWPYIYKLQPAYFKGRAFQHFFFSIAASLLVFILDSYPPFQKPFHWNITQYLGEISFGIYVCHIQVLKSFYRQLLKPLQDNYLGTGFLSCALVMLLSYIVIFWAGDLFTRVDAKLIDVGRRLERRLFVY